MNIWAFSKHMCWLGLQGFAFLLQQRYLLQAVSLNDSHLSQVEVKGSGVHTVPPCSTIGELKLPELCSFGHIHISFPINSSKSSLLFSYLNQQYVKSCLWFKHLVIG